MSLLISAGVVSQTLWTSAAPALTYRLYTQEWHLTHLVTAGIVALYPIGVVTMLVIFGSVSDQIGLRAAMLAGVFASLVGSLMFAMAPNVWWLFGGRALTGVGVGLSVSPSTAAILEFSGGLKCAKSAALITMSAQAVGCVAALLLGGALTQYAPWPTRLCFWALATFLVALLVATWFLPSHAVKPDGNSRRAGMPSLSGGVGWAVAMSSTAIMAAYTFGVLVLSLGGQVEHDLIGSPNAFSNGIVLSLFPVVVGVVGVMARLLSPRLALTSGALASGLSMLLVVLAVNLHNLLIFLLSTVVAGGAYSMLFVGSQQVINAVANARHRGRLLSALYLLGYLSMGALGLILGAVATTWGLGPAIDLGAVTIIFLNVATLVVAAMTVVSNAISPAST